MKYSRMMKMELSILKYMLLSVRGLQNEFSWPRHLFDVLTRDVTRMNKVIKGLKANEQKVNTEVTQVQGARVNLQK